MSVNTTTQKPEVHQSERTKDIYARAQKLQKKLGDDWEIKMPPLGSELHYAWVHKNNIIVCEPEAGQYHAMLKVKAGTRNEDLWDAGHDAVYYSVESALLAIHARLQSEIEYLKAANDNLDEILCMLPHSG